MSESFEMDTLLLGDERISNLQGKMSIVGDKINEQIVNLFNDIELTRLIGTAEENWSGNVQKLFQMEGILANYGDKVLLMLLKKGDNDTDLIMVENAETIGTYAGKVMNLPSHLHGDDLETVILSMHGLHGKEFDFTSQQDAIITLK